MQKVQEAVVGKNQQTVGLKVKGTDFTLHYITMYLTDIKVTNEALLTTQAFVLSRFKKQTLKLSTQIRIRDKLQNQDQT